MTMVTVYDPEGNEHQREAVDARECVESLKWSMEPPKGKKPAAKVEDAEEKQLQLDEARGLLDSRNIEYKMTHGVVHLRKLIKASDPAE